MSANIEHNAFIFNWVENYDKQVDDLKSTLEKLKNKVEVYQYLTREELLRVLEHCK